MNYDDLARISLQGLIHDREQCRQIIHCPENRILELIQSAFRVREKYFGEKVIFQQLINAKSGLCAEDCAYCSQSAKSQASIEKYPVLDEQSLFDGAIEAQSKSASRYCIVTSGSNPNEKELDHMCRTISRIKSGIGIEICASLGFLSEESAVRLKLAGADRYNHNLNTSENFYPTICNTHSYADRIDTLNNAKKAGLSVCCGALLGMGESDDDIIDLALALRKVGAASIPVNFLHPIEGTNLGNEHNLTPLKCLSILCLMRFLNPQTEIRVAGGREYHLRSLQPLALYPANSIFVSGYLTTDGQEPDEAAQMVADLGFEVEQEAVEKVKTAL